MDQYDVIVIGSGPGGYVGAIRAAHHGLRTALVEKDDKLGGTCLLRGCIPTKSLLHSADLLTAMRGAAAFGISARDIAFDFAAVQRAREKVVAKSAAGVAYLMKQNQVDVCRGLGRLTDPHTVEVTSSAEESPLVLTARHVLLATGSVPKSLPMLPVDGRHVVTSNELLAVDQPPASLLVLGAGAVGIEFASIFNRFGTRCTVVEMLERVLPMEDEDVSAELEKQLKKRGIAVHTNTKLERVSVQDGRVEATAMHDTETLSLTADRVLVAVGRTPVTTGLGLDNVGLAVDRDGFIPVNEHMQTDKPHIYAIGDVVRTPQLAHVASAEALLAIDHLAGKPTSPLNYDHTPSCVYCDPEVASCGLSESAAKARGRSIKIGKFPFAALGKARVLGQTDGWVKIVADATYDEILGVHMIGPHVTDLLGEACVALRLEATATELAHTMHAHPTLPEALLEAAHGVVGRPIHL